MYCVSGRGIVPDGCGSTAVAAKLMKSDNTASGVKSTRDHPLHPTMRRPRSGMMGTR